MRRQTVVLWLATTLSAIGSAFHLLPPFSNRLVPVVVMNAVSGGDGIDETTTAFDRRRRQPRDVVVIGGGIQGVSCAYHMHESPYLPIGSTITILEAKGLASAASGKGGGFMARGWGDGTCTRQLHEVAFDMYETLCVELGVTSYRKLPVVGITPGDTDRSKMKHPEALGGMIPNWLDGRYGDASPMGYGDDTAQVTPSEFVSKMMERANYDNGREKSTGIKLIIGKCVGIESDVDEDGKTRVVTGVKYRRNDGDGEGDGEGGGGKAPQLLRADDVIVASGPWACQAEDWFGMEDGGGGGGGDAISLPMEGVKSTSIVWRPPVDDESGMDMPHAVDATALFCGEDDRYGTHLEVYPRPDGTIYICGIGGSDYITTAELRESAFLDECPPNSDRVEAATSAFQTMSNSYATMGVLSHSQACMRPCPPDALPYMGKISGWSGAYINAGHNCWGIAWAPACGKAMAELVLEGASRSVNLMPFDPARFASRGKGGRGRKKGSVNVGEQW